MRTLQRHEVILRDIFRGNGGVRLKGHVGLYRSVDGKLVFSTIVHVTAFGTDPCLSGKGLQWSDTDQLPEELGVRVMDLTAVIEKVVGVRGARESISDFLAPMADALFTANRRLLTLVHQKRCNRVRQSMELAEIVHLPVCRQLA